jgi:hypothetical protein
MRAVLVVVAPVALATWLAQSVADIIMRLIEPLFP